MKFFLDHNLSPQLIHTLRALLPKSHVFATARDEQLTDTDDVPLFTELVARKFDTLITRDRNQLFIPEERKALIASGLHWLGVSQAKAGGLRGLALESASISIGLTIVLPDLNDRQRAYQLKAIPHENTQRIKPINLQM